MVQYHPAFPWAELLSNNPNKQRGAQGILGIIYECKNLPCVPTVFTYL